MIITETRLSNGVIIARCTCCKSRHRIAAKYAAEEFVCCNAEEVSSNLVLEEQKRPVNKYSRR